MPYLTSMQQQELNNLMLETAPRVPPTPEVEAGESAVLTTVRRISEMRNERNKAYRRRLKDVATKYLLEKAARRTMADTIRARDTTIADLRRDLGVVRMERDNLLLARREQPSTPLNEQLRQLHETAIIWRDATKGTSAKLNAFRNFCAVLDSLPAPAQNQTPGPDFTLAG